MPNQYLKLRRRCELILNNIELPRPFSLDVLCERVSEQRGRPLHLRPLPREAAESGVCGLWIGTTTADHVFYEAQTSPVHREHIVLHEIGHMLFGHNTLDQRKGDDVQALLPDLDPGRVRRLFGRTNYTTRQEREAEMLASLIRMRADQPQEEKPQGVLEKLESALGVRASDVV
ncbi:hypothetical protein OG883_05560 [Streptomyces sp. NBC_01142]|uniref:hypothetical protein n=1 Tax=Streptomyces sp. NBC_01142 TaxID=2975865 RepID=UPI00224D41E4|nr:hypothetical protein [Streptomyces sp. NBC_01142]MCX4819380.1 hypothetical protein [Streptomyces sp. NBC_01142]